MTSPYSTASPFSWIWDARPRVLIGIRICPVCVAQSFPQVPPARFSLGCTPSRWWALDAHRARLEVSAAPATCVIADMQAPGMQGRSLSTLKAPADASCDRRILAVDLIQCTAPACLIMMSGFLSLKPCGRDNVVDAWPNDDGTGRQRWLLKPSNGSNGVISTDLATPTSVNIQVDRSVWLANIENILHATSFCWTTCNAWEPTMVASTSTHTGPNDWILFGSWLEPIWAENPAGFLNLRLRAYTTT